MATPAWVRHHRTHRHHAITLALTELALQAEHRVQIEIEDDDWTPRQTSTFADDR